MAHVRALALGLGLIGHLLLAVGCGDDSPPGVPPDEDEDAQVDEDGGADPDAETDPEDATDSDAGADAAEPDSDGGEISQCEGDVLEFQAARPAGRPLTAAISGNRAHLVYMVPSGGAMASDSQGAQGLRYVAFDTTGTASTPVDLVNVGIDLYNRTRDPSLVSRDTKLDLFFTATNNGPFDLFYKDMVANAEIVQESSGLPARNEFALFAGAFGSDVAVAYSNEQPTTVITPGAIALKISGQASQELVPESAGYHAGQLVFTDLGASGERHGVAAFLSDLAAKPGIFTLPIDANGAAAGPIATLTTQIGGVSMVDVARGRDGAAGLIYTEAPGMSAVHQLRFREIAADGSISTTVKSLTSANQDLRDVSIAAYSHGYVIAYRRAGGVPNAAASIYLLFVDASGNKSGTRLVRSAALTGGGLKVLVANDGRLIVAWADAETMMNPTTLKPEITIKVRATRLTCAL